MVAVLDRVVILIEEHYGMTVCMYRVAQNKLDYSAFNSVYENLHKIMHLHSLVAHRQIRRQKRNVHLNILR